MTDEELKTTVAEILKDDREGASYLQGALQKMRAIGAALEAVLGPGVVEVHVEVVAPTLEGQMCCFVVVVPKAGIRDLIFRLYVRPSGPPMSLELFNYIRPVGVNGTRHHLCSSFDALEATVLAFLATPDIKQGLLQVKDVAKDIAA